LGFPFHPSSHYPWGFNVDVSLLTARHFTRTLRSIPNAETDAALAVLRARLRNRFRLATTVGYGPRFLHSTGQLHKDDAGNGLFIQFTADDPRDAPIPNEAGWIHLNRNLHLLPFSVTL
jgi:hypothetical protein